MTTEEKFHAAVNVIRSLPKNGSYQPSNALMLRFYAYFKQASQGPCKGSRPPFWDIVGRAKYDAYKDLGNMSKQDAMKHYVDELHRIVETMSYSDKVENFLEAPPNELDSLNMADLELIVGDVMERVRSRSNSPLGSRDVSPNRLHSNASTSPSDLSSSAEESDHSDEEYIDSVEIPEPRKPLENGIIHTDRILNGYGFKENPSSRMKSKSASHSNVDISQEVNEAINKLRIDVEHLSHRVNELESLKSGMKQASQKKHPNTFFNGMSSQLIGFLIVWPFLVSLITYRYIHRK